MFEYDTAVYKLSQYYPIRTRLVKSIACLLVSSTCASHTSHRFRFWALCFACPTQKVRQTSFQTSKTVTWAHHFAVGQSLTPKKFAPRHACAWPGMPRGWSSKISLETTVLSAVGFSVNDSHQWKHKNFSVWQNSHGYHHNTDIHR